MRLHDYVQEIFDISAANDVSWDVGKDMFLTNIRNAGQEGMPCYPGVEGLDYAILKPHYEELADSAVEFVLLVQKRYSEIVEAREAGDGPTLFRLMELTKNE